MKLLVKNHVQHLHVVHYSTDLSFSLRVHPFGRCFLQTLQVVSVPGRIFVNVCNEKSHISTVISKLH